MRKIIIISMLIFSIVGAYAQDSNKKSKKEKRAEKEAIKIEETKALLESKVYVFSATQALPSGMRSVNLDSSYDVKVNNDTIICYLPFYGRAYSAGYGSGEGPFNFTLPNENYTIKRTKKDGYEVKFDVKNKNDNLNFNIQIGRTGSSSLIITSTNRQSISYYGNIEKAIEKK